MPMPMRMRLAGGIVRPMRVLVMFVVRMKMVVLHSFVTMFVFMVLGQVQPDPRAHQPRRDEKAESDSVSQQHNRNSSADERRRGEVSAGPRSTDVAKGENKQHQADAVAHKPDEAGSQQSRNT